MMQKSFFYRLQLAFTYIVMILKLILVLINFWPFSVLYLTLLAFVERCVLMMTGGDTEDSKSCSSSIMPKIRVGSTEI